MTSAMILGAGLGTRLRPLTDRLAKPLVPVGDGPAVAQVLARVRLASPERVALNVHHRPEDLRSWAEAEGVGVSHEPLLLGTAGGVHGARALLGEGDVLVWNGDILSDLDPRLLLAAHAEAGATLAVRPRAVNEGTVGLAADGRIVRLRDVRFGDEARGGDYLGVHVLAQALRDRLPASGGLVEDVWLPALGRGEALRAYETDATFVDIGSLPEYLAANAAWLAARGATWWAHPTAIVAPGIDITGSVIGAHAIVEASACHSVIWPGARVHAACEGVVVLP